MKKLLATAILTIALYAIPVNAAVGPNPIAIGKYLNSQGVKTGVSSETMYWAWFVATGSWLGMGLFFGL